MKRSDAVNQAADPPVRPAAGISRPLLTLQCVSACAGTTLGSIVGTGTMGKLVASAGGALIAAFLTAPGRHHPRRIVAVGLLLALLDEGKALAATVRGPRTRRGHASVLPGSSGVVATAAVAVIGFGAGWAVAASPFVSSPTAGETAGRGSTMATLVSSHTAPVVAHEPRARHTGHPSRAIKHQPAAHAITTAPPPVTTPAVVHRPVRARGPSGPPSIVVPDVAGDTLSGAQTRLKAAGFTHTTTSYQTSPITPQGTVLNTDPAGGMTAPATVSIVIVVSSGPPKVAVPDVTGMPVKTALSTLQQAGLQPKTSAQSSNTVKSGNVITTTPGPNTPVAPGSPIVVFYAI